MDSRQKREQIAQRLRDVGINIKAVFGGYEVVINDETKYIEKNNFYAFVYGLSASLEISSVSTTESKDHNAST